MSTAINLDPHLQPAPAPPDQPNHSFPSPGFSSKRTRTWRRRAQKPVLAAVSLAAIVWGVKGWYFTADGASTDITATVTRADLPITVTERGELESSKTIEVRCEVEGFQNKIVSIVAEGTHVKKGDVVVTFDTDQLKKTRDEQEVKWKTAEGKAKAAKSQLEVDTNKAETDLDKARLDLKLADLDVEKYLKGEYPALLDKAKGDLAQSKKELEEAKEKLERFRKFVKRGFGSEDQLRAKELDVSKTEFIVKSKEGELDVLTNFTKVRQSTELTHKAKDARRNLERAEKTGKASVDKAQSDWETAFASARIEKLTLERNDKQLENCKVKAPADGILVYAKDRWWDDSSRIQAGAMVHFRQGLFSLPDLAKMQMKVKIHEAMVKKVKPDHKAEIRIDAYPNVVLHGTVKSVATLAASEGFFDRFVKEYETIITIDDLPTDGGLKPGFTGEVKILVQQLADVLVIPVQAVGQKDGQHCCYVAGLKGAERRTITVGENNDKFVEVKEGLNESEKVTLDARSRIAAETKASEAKPDAPTKGKPEPPPIKAAPAPPPGPGGPPQKR